MAPIDAVLLLSFGGPEQPADIMPFLRRVTAGRGIPDERLASVALQYEQLGGRSPINDQNRQLRAALEAELRSRANDDAVSANPELSAIAHAPVYWGNRNWDPFLTDTLRQMRTDGVQRAAVLVTSGYSSYSGCRQYRENLYDAQAELAADDGGDGPELLKIRRWFDHPAFIEAMTDNVMAAIASIDDSATSDVRLAFTTHSIPIAQAQNSGDPAGGGNFYQRQHEFVAEAIAERIAQRTGRAYDWSLVFQSRSGAPHIPWLEPDISDHIDTLAAQGATAVVIVPIGFMSDHMEVLWDLDSVAIPHAKERGLTAARAATVGTDPRFVAALIDMVFERAQDIPQQQRPALSQWGPAPDRCPVGCCANPRDPRPALCGSD